MQQDLGGAQRAPGAPCWGSPSPCGVGEDTSALVRQMEYAGRELVGTALLEWVCEGQTMQFCPIHAFGSVCRTGAVACPIVGQKDRATPASLFSIFPVRQPLSLLHEGCSSSTVSFHVP